MKMRARTGTELRIIENAPWSNQPEVNRCFGHESLLSPSEVRFPDTGTFVAKLIANDTNIGTKQVAGTWLCLARFPAPDADPAQLTGCVCAAQNFQLERRKMFIGAGLIEIIIIIILGMGGGAGIPLGVPPGPEDPVMSAVAPEQPLFYTSWAGSIAPDPNNNPTEAWMAQPELEVFFGKLVSLLKSQMDTNLEGRERAMWALSWDIVQQAYSRPGAVFVSSFEMADGVARVSGGTLIDLGDQAGKLVHRMNGLARLNAAKFGTEVTSISLDEIEASMVVFEDGGANNPIHVTWGLWRDQYLMIAIGPEQMQQMLANLKTDPPIWLQGMRKDLPVSRVSTVSYVDFRPLWTAAENTPSEVQKLLRVSGLEQIKTVRIVGGLDSQGFVARTSVQIDGDPRGVLALVDGEPLDMADFNRVGTDEMVLVASRFSWPKLHDLIREFSALGSRDVNEVDEMTKQLNAAAEIDVRKDVMDQLGDVTYVYGTYSPLHPYGFVFAVDADNEAQLKGPYEKMVEALRKELGKSTQAAEIEVDRYQGLTIYSVDEQVGMGIVPLPLWTLGDGEFMLSFEKGALRRHIRRKDNTNDQLVQADWFQGIFGSS